jgi:hypothetical protein
VKEHLKDLLIAVYSLWFGGTLSMLGLATRAQIAVLADVVL